jgi:hypothetical protein
VIADSACGTSGSVEAIVADEQTTVLEHTSAFSADASIKPGIYTDEELAFVP